MKKMHTQNIRFFSSEMETEREKKRRYLSVPDNQIVGNDLEKRSKITTTSEN